MKNIDSEIITKKTNEKIGYYNYLEEAKKIKKRNNRLLSIGCAVFIIGICTITVDALTNNALLPLGKNIIKVNGKDAEAEIYEKKPEEIYDRYTGEYTLTTGGKCITYYPFKDKEDNASTICYPYGTEFESIEIYYDKNNHYCGLHITGISSDGKNFEDNFKDYDL